MKKEIIFLWIATLIVLIFVAFAQRYSLSLPCKIDRLTGKVWLLSGGVQKEITQEKNPAATKHYIDKFLPEKE
jgi:hypothetical protein